MDVSGIGIYFAEHGYKRADSASAAVELLIHLQVVAAQLLFTTKRDIRN